MNVVEVVVDIQSLLQGSQGPGPMDPAAQPPSNTNSGGAAGEALDDIDYGFQCAYDCLRHLSLQLKFENPERANEVDAVANKVNKWKLDRASIITDHRAMTQATAMRGFSGAG